jgi:polyribonucleotide nucleotidyltransferase
MEVLYMMSNETPGYADALLPHRFETTFGGRKLILATGKIAEQADGAVLVRYGDTIVLAATVGSDEPRIGVDFFPLTVDYEERLYAAGKIPGAFLRREGRPSESAVLTSRLTDRPLRPLFPKGYRNDVQVSITSLSADQENEPDILAIIGASAALTISDIPFYGPIAGIRIGLINDEFVVMPTASQMAESTLELKVAATRDAIMMVECGASEIPEARIIEALRLAHQELQPIIALQDEMRAALGRPKREFTVYSPAADVRREVEAYLADKLTAAFDTADKAQRDQNLQELRDELLAKFGEAYGDKDILAVFDELEKRHVRSQILEKGLRPDGRDLVTIRPISCAVGLLPRTHGSGLFSRGQTQVLSIATLGSVGDKQKIDTLSLTESKRYMHHYNMPPFSTGEARPLRSPGRREIGHGALAERALMSVLPLEEDFPYTIRVVSEVLSSNGSTSMASVCGSTLALMDAGVPITSPVAGIAMGLIKGDDNYAVLTDIQGLEDNLGDMDFKVAGTADGVTAMQMDIKVKGITTEIMEIALAQAKEARLFILRQMLNAIDKARPDISPFAPKILRLKINPEKIGAVIGPGGKQIREIQSTCKVEIEIEDDGTVTIASAVGGDAEKAAGIVRGLTEDVEVGKIYLGTVKRIVDFGAFVEILPGKEGLVRIGDMAEYRVNKVEDVVKLGDEIMVMVIEVDSQGRVNLSRRAVLEGATPGSVQATDRGSRGGGGGRDFGRRPDRDRRLPGPGRPSTSHSSAPRPDRDRPADAGRTERPAESSRPERPAESGHSDQPDSSHPLGKKW